VQKDTREISDLWLREFTIVGKVAAETPRAFLTANHGRSMQIRLLVALFTISKVRLCTDVHVWSFFVVLRFRAITYASKLTATQAAIR
jgi:hypothetical protein